ncbi:Hypothetical predicted protein [Cloeon dipterum]|uniref:F-box domain-containing protein n=1 Tax=Cloeon dipterum TaxID=197152 RepID=A0A8S1CAD2_9INSE|nr:Hypothetical predicted protein [Cloeon dipterum]
MPPVFSPDEVFADLVKDLFKNKENQDDSYRRDALERAVSPTMKKIDFAQVMDLFPENDPQIIDVFTSITRRASNILILKIKEGMLAERNLNCISMSEEMVNAISEMTNLEILQVGRFSLSLSRLMGLLCRNNLRSLKVLYFKVEPSFEVIDVEIFSRSFWNLKTFQFSPASNDIRLNDLFRRILTLECISCLSNLRILGDPDDKRFFNTLPTCLETNNEMAELECSKLTSLMLYLDRNIPENALKKFRFVKHLHIQWGVEKYDIAGLMKFQRLTRLTFIDLDDLSYLEKFLSSYGVFLVHLLLSFRLPFLVDSLALCSSALQSEIELPSCNSLKELELEFTTNCTHRESYIFITEYLRSWNLEKVRLIRVSTTVEELGRTAKLIERRNILTRVVHFELHLIENDSIQNQNHNATQESNAEFLLSALIDLRNLKQPKYGVR